MTGGTGEVARELDEELGGRPRVAVDDLVVVAHPEAVVRRGGQQPDEQQVSRVEVLELVHQQVAAAGLGPHPGVGIGQEDLDGLVDLLVEIDGTEVRQGRTVGGEPLGDARRVGNGFFDHGRRGQSEPDGRESLEVGSHGVGIGLPADFDVALQQVSHGALLQHPSAAGRTEFVADPEPEAVQGADIEGGCPGNVLATQPQVCGRLVVVGQRRDRARMHPPVDDQVTKSLGEDPGLARARRSDDPGRPGAVADGGQLVRSQLR